MQNWFGVTTEVYGAVWLRLLRWSASQFGTIDVLDGLTTANLSNDQDSRIVAIFSCEDGSVAINWAASAQVVALASCAKICENRPSDCQER